MTKIDTTVVLTSFDGFENIELILHGYNNQAYRLFEVVIVTEDNSETLKARINTLSDNLFYDIHITSQTSFLERCHTDYIIFSNTNVLPQQHFVEQHVKLREQGYFIAGETMAFGKAENITNHTVYNDDCFNFNWLREHGLEFRDRKGITICNNSAWKSDVLKFENTAFLKTKSGLESNLRRRSLKEIALRSQYICLHLQRK